MVSISVSEDDFGEFVASYFLILYELATPTICACLLGNYWYCRFGSFQHNIYIYIAIVHAQASGYFLYSMQGRYGRKSLFLFGPVPFRLPAHTRRSVPKEKWTKKMKRNS